MNPIPIGVTVTSSTHAGIRLHQQSGTPIVKVNMMPSGEGLACIDGVWMRVDNLTLEKGQLLEVYLESI